MPERAEKEVGPAGSGDFLGWKKTCGEGSGCS